MLIGSKAFRHLWKDWQRDYRPLQVLKLLLAYIEMPEDLSGELEETQHLLSYFDPDLAPHDSFWKDVVKLVDLAFLVIVCLRMPLLRDKSISYVI